MKRNKYEKYEKKDQNSGKKSSQKVGNKASKNVKSKSVNKKTTPSKKNRNHIKYEYEFVDEKNDDRYEINFDREFRVYQEKFKKDFRKFYYPKNDVSKVARIMPLSHEIVEFSESEAPEFNAKIQFLGNELHFVDETSSFLNHISSKEIGVEYYSEMLQKLEIDSVKINYLLQQYRAMPIILTNKHRGKEAEFADDVTTSKFDCLSFKDNGYEPYLALSTMEMLLDEKREIVGFVPEWVEATDGSEVGIFYDKMCLNYGAVQFSAHEITNIENRDSVVDIISYDRELD